MSLYVRAEFITPKEYYIMSEHPLRDAVAAQLDDVGNPDVLSDAPDVLAGKVLTVVADALYASVETTTDARKRTIIDGIAHRIERGNLP